MSAEDSKTGAETHQLFQKPTHELWESFVKHYGPKIYGWCQNHLRPAPSLVDDAAQTVLVNLWEKMENGGLAHWDPSKGRLHHWLRTVVRNVCRDALRKYRPTV